MQDRIDYENLVQNALLNVIRDILADVAANGLPGEHHFYITFSTQKAGVQISERLKERFPETMTIVLQHRFWDMQLFADSFTVTLSFGGIAEKLLVPFAAMQIFYDPAAAFEVAFTKPARDEDEEALAAEQQRDEENAIVTFPPPKHKREKDYTEKTEKNLSPPVPVPQDYTNAITENALYEQAGGSEKAERNNGTAPANQAGKQRESSASIVSLDAFRKK
ncbi:MAG: hypothetical protein DU429_08815 [Candidatus Tokpelaia sp.]|nr:MAG: hypothetical protein DU429_08815 [Candidatus Tokpelaia sp.]